MRLIPVYILALFLSAPLVKGQDGPPPLDDVPLPPTLPDPLKSGEAIEPEVVIIRTDEAVIEEYRLNGKHYMTRITPVVGPAYYLVDRDGDGQMESRMSEIYDDFHVPQWVLFSW